MIELREALTLLDGEIRRLPKETVELSFAHQRYLAEDATSDVDVPPHRKSLVDGYAVCSADFDGKDISLEVIDEVVAGGWPRTGIGRGQAIRIMTGAAVPTGADAVVMVMKTTHKPAERMKFALRTYDLNMEGKKIFAKSLMKLWVLLIARKARLVAPTPGAAASSGTPDV